MQNNLPDQKDFISLFPNTRFRYLHDVTKAVVQGNDTLELSWNERGYGVFFTVNGFPATGEATQAQLVSLNANYVDIDFDVSLSQEELDRLVQDVLMIGLDAGVPGPTIVNRTRRGVHAIWLYPETITPTVENVVKWRDVQKRLVRCFKGDRAAIDPARVLRLPYTLHLKDPKNPFEVKVASYKPEARQTLDELDGTVPKYSEDTVGNNGTLVAEVLKNGVRVGEGMRHMAIAQVAGLALKEAKTPEQVELARLALYGWDRCIVRSPELFQDRKKELDDTIDGIWKRETEKRGTSGQTRSNALQLWTMNDILTHDFGIEEWVVESLIPRQGMMILSGSPGDFKTWVTIHIALCLSRNVPVFGKFKVTQGSVLVIDEENHLRLLKKRLGLLGARDVDDIHYLSQNGIKVDNEVVRDAILKIVKEKNVKLLILDSLVRVHEQDENDAKGMAKVFSSLQEIIKAGASILFTHHHRKQMGFGANNPGQSMRGSSDILAAVDCHVTIEKKKDEDGRLILRQTKLRQAEALLPFEVSVLKGESGPSGFEYAGGHDEKKLKAEEASAAVVVVLADGMRSRAGIHETLKSEFGKTAIDDGIKLAEETSEIERVPKHELPKADNRKAYYRLPITSGGGELPASQLHIEAGSQDEDIWPESTPEPSPPPLSLLPAAPSGS